MSFFGQNFLGFIAAAALIFESSAWAFQRPQYELRYLDDSSQLRVSYDYVIVGGGTSGLTVADRLTEDGKSTVLVIENGPLVESPLISEIMGGFGGMGSGYTYNTMSVPQSHLRNRTFPVLTGRVVGGSSAVNAMMTVRGTSEDYDRWGELFGQGSSWNWKNLLPYFKKALSFTLPDPLVASAFNITHDLQYWGNTSHIYAGWPSFQYPGLVPAIDAFREVPGVEFPVDSGAGRAGVYWFPTFLDPKNVQRSYAKTGHYERINRTNYDLIADTRVTKVLFDGRRAIGVSAQQTRLNTTLLSNVNASKEVILAAGAIHTPQLLQLSGLGPKKLLESAGVQTIVDLPGVGQNFQDHPMLSTVQNFTIHPEPSDLFGESNFSTWAQEVWAFNRTGPYSLGVGNVAAWLPMPVISPTYHETIASKLETQEHSAFLAPGTDPTVVEGYRAQMKNLASSIRSNNTAFYSLSLTGSRAPGGASVFLHPLSRGTVNIDVRKPNATEPIVDYRALSNPLDVEILVEFIKFTRLYHFNTSLAAFNPKEIAPGENVKSSEELAAYVQRSITPSEYHPSGTAAMLPRELGGVVNESLLVYGVDGLRIVDASIMPTLPGANTCQTVYAVAEKAADLIKSRL
ncbi:hypothetical protein JX265_013575 [Neoarthrinium moseri]|uniref:Glucose-methanol-choline oxidoreductase N-terminal domain-containing protein n=1 Tax=Neoarthrinium moseri TaxID=1658444 RepID=A0A9P9W8D3_9PEZI|nr:hypothetical protein JX265_013575 [Neoarthrinium moseri]